MVDAANPLPEPVDQAARVRVLTDLDSTLIVEAGAGTGKTTALVGRVVALVEDGAPIESIAAITFTDKAATELRDRVRRELENRAEAGSATAAAALIDLDGAALCTLHAFAQRLLVEHPIEAGLPPAVEVMDDVAALIDFGERWSSTVDDLLSDEAHEFTVLAALELGIRLDHLRKLARTCDDNWDLIDDRLTPTAEPRPIDVEDALDEARAVVALADHCSDPSDSMAVRLDEIAVIVEAIAGAVDDPLAVIRALEDLDPFMKVKRTGNKRSWTGDVGVAEVRERLIDVGEQLGAEVQRLRDEVIDRLTEVIGRASVAAAGKRRRQGQLGFHDLLVFAQRLLTHPDRGPTVRSDLHERYRHLLLDEFQDTDPVQVELATRIADPGGSGAWPTLRPADGSLFVVGDPKQSIYGFRRADIALYLEARDAFGADRVRLDQNFRTTGPVLDWVNGVFARLIIPSPGAQPDYTPLVAAREASPSGPSVLLLGDRHGAGGSAEAIRDTSADDVAATVSEALNEGWLVHRNGDWRACRPQDVTILVRSRTPVAALAAALDHLDVPHRIEAGGDRFATDDVRDVRLVLRAVDDPTDPLNLVCALRTSLLGCRDADLLDFHRAGGVWDIIDPGDHGLPDVHPVVAAMRWLHSVHDERRWASAADLVARVVRDRMAFEVATSAPRARDSWRRLRTFADTARSFGENRGGDLREFLRWCDLHVADEVRDDEVVPPEADDDAVRIMTMHAAKGLEFPICVLADLGSRPSSDGFSLEFPGDRSIAVSFTADRSNAAARDHADEADRLEHLERIRLLYVAATRARDHLVVALHHQSRKEPPDKLRNYSLAEIVCGGLDDDAVFAAPPPPRLYAPPSRPAAVDIPPQDDWRAADTARRAAGARQRTVGASRLTIAGGDDHRTAAQGGEDGRHGPAIGRAVHRALEVAGMHADGDAGAAEARAEAQAAARDEGVDEGTVVKMVDATLRSPSVRAAGAGAWRELYVAAPVDDDVLLEGYVDLAYRTPEGLVVVDYKTDAWASEADLDAKVADYRLQGGAYAWAVQAVSGEPVSRMVFVFVGGPEPVERDLDDLAAAMADARRAAVGPVVDG